MTTAAASSGHSLLAPVDQQGRIDALDVLRGFALFGVLLVNMRNFDLPGQIWTGSVDGVALWLTRAFAEGKFWRLLSFLFGIGFALQLERVRAQDAGFHRVYLRRASVLLLFGALHHLIYDGDILFDYALLGCLLLLFHRLSSRIILFLAFACFLIPVARHAADLRSDHVASASPSVTQPAAADDAEQAAQRERRERFVRLVTEGSAGEFLAFGARQFARRYASVEAYEEMIGDSFPLFLLGLYVGRRRVFQNLRAHVPMIRTVLRWGMVIGLAGTLVSLAGQWPTPRSPLSQSARTISGFLWFVVAPALTFAYAAALVLLTQRRTWAPRLAPLAAVGRMALTNYLLQSLIFTTMFLGWGVGLYGKIGPALNVLVTAVIYGVNVALSVWWLARFRFGPAEWLWRCATYAEWQPLRLRRGRP